MLFQTSSTTALDLQGAATPDPADLMFAFGASLLIILLGTDVMKDFRHLQN